MSGQVRTNKQNPDSIKTIDLHPGNLDHREWLAKSDKLYHKSFKNKHALKNYTAILNDIAGRKGDEFERIFIESAIQYAKITPARLPAQKAIDILRNALEKAQKKNMITHLCLLHMHLAKLEWFCANFKEAFEHFQKRRAYASEIDDERILHLVSLSSTYFLYWQGRYQEAISSYEKSISDIDRFPSRRSSLLVKLMMSECYCYLGQVSQAMGMVDTIRAYCYERKDWFSASTALAVLAQILLYCGKFEDAIKPVEESMKHAIQQQNSFVCIYNHLGMALIHHHFGNTQRAVVHCKKYMELSEKVEIKVMIYPHFLKLCWEMELGNIPKIPGISFINEMNRFLQSDNICTRGVAYRYLALTQRSHRDSPEIILHSLDLSRKWLEESGHQLELGKTQLELARQYILMEKEEKARDFMQDACSCLTPFDRALIPDDLNRLISNQPLDEKLFREILKVSREIVTIQDSHDLVQQILSMGNKLTGAERGAIFILEEDTSPHKLTLRASKNLTSKQVKDASFSISNKMLKSVFSSGKGQMLQGSEISGAAGKPEDVIRSRICVPMILRDKIVGVLYHDNRLLRSVFKDTDMELLNYFGALAAFALDNTVSNQNIRQLNRKLQEEKKYYEEQQHKYVNFESMVGESLAVKHVIKQITHVGPTESNVLILGETGVGKELIAKAIHNQSPRRDKPLICVNCSALPESLISSELFGHEKGAFTGAIQQRLGRFELADGGTIFLDEIGELPLEVQVRLLRVLQSKEFERVGGTKTIRSDFRLVTATNRDLKELVREGRFRSDLFYRLNVFPIYVPPLRERKEDIRSLVYHFLNLYGRKMGKSFKVIPKEEMDKLIRYDWMGNVRELENIIERSIILSIPPNFIVPELDSIGSDQNPFLPAHDKSLKDNERSHILRTMQAVGWKVRGSGGAAELLDIHPSTLEFRMKKLGIERPSTTPKSGKHRTKEQSALR